MADGPCRCGSPFARIAAIRQHQFAQLPVGIRILVVAAPRCDSAEIRAATERAIRAALAQLHAASARVEVDIVEHVDRTGSGAKVKLVH